MNRFQLCLAHRFQDTLELDLILHDLSVWLHHLSPRQVALLTQCHWALLKSCTLSKQLKANVCLNCAALSPGYPDDFILSLQSAKHSY